MSAETIQEFWKRINGDRAVWRTARKEQQWCGQCMSWAIHRGDRYLDTGERIEVWATSKCCAACAAQPSVSRSEIAEKLGVPERLMG